MSHSPAPRASRAPASPRESSWAPNCCPYHRENPIRPLGNPRKTSPQPHRLAHKRASRATAPAHRLPRKLARRYRLQLVFCPQLRATNHWRIPCLPGPATSPRRAIPARITAPWRHQGPAGKRVSSAPSAARGRIPIPNQAIPAAAARSRTPSSARFHGALQRLIFFPLFLRGAGPFLTAVVFPACPPPIPERMQMIHFKRKFPIPAPCRKNANLPACFQFSRFSCHFLAAKRQEVVY